VRAETPWLDPRVVPHVRALRATDGLAEEGVTPQGIPWQEPDPDWESTGRTDLHVAVDTEGRTDDRRSDFDEVYGDWREIAARVHTEMSTVDSDVRAALRCAERDPGGLSESDAVALMTADGAALDAVCRLADDLRRDTVGDDVTYVVNRNINFTNVCYTGCRFCAFAQRATDADAYTLSTDEIERGCTRPWPKAPPRSACRAASIRRCRPPCTSTWRAP